MHADFDPALAGVIDVVREAYAPIGAAMAESRPVHPVEFGALAGAVDALLKALDARTSPAPVQALKAVA